MKARERELGLSTIALHGGRPAPETGEPVVTPIVQSSNFTQDFGTAAGLKYPRYGNTPNADSVQRRIAMLEGGEASLVLSSGMGATACALLALVRPGDHVLASSMMYGGTLRLLTQEFATLGIDVTMVDPFEARAWRRRLRRETRALFIESPVNPTCRVIDMKPLRHLSVENGLALVVDSTFASPVNFRPLDHGADVVIHSATKFLNGHHDVVAGAVIGTASYIEEVRQKMMIWGQAPDPFALWLLERGVKTLDIRVRRQNDNATRIADWCTERSEIKRVHYPGLTSHPDHATAKSVMTNGFGGMLAVELNGGPKASERFVRRLRIWRYAPSLGGVDSLISEPRYTSHTHLSSEERAKIGIPDGFLRLSVGIEDADDLIADLAQALR
jgi:cystathionine beta-lyase/cystathionine gamma-synthase